MFILQTEKYVLKKVVKAIFFNCEFDAASEAALIYSWMDRVQRCESTELKVGLCVSSLPLARWHEALLTVASSPLLSCHGIRQTLDGSFSAVSKPNFASKYAFESSRRDLHNALLCTALKSHFFLNLLFK